MNYSAILHLVKNWGDFVSGRINASRLQLLFGAYEKRQIEKGILYERYIQREGIYCSQGWLPCTDIEGPSDYFTPRDPGLSFAQTH